MASFQTKTEDLSKLSPSYLIVIPSLLHVLIMSLVCAHKVGFLNSCQLFCTTRMFHNGVCCICFVFGGILSVCVHGRVRNILLTDK